MKKQSAISIQQSAKAKRSEQGSSLAWTAIVLSFLLVPLLTLIADGGRLLSVRTQLQTATDAACEDAAWSAADYRAYRDLGTTTFDYNYYWIARAQNTFERTLSENKTKIYYSASVSIIPNYGTAFVTCYARAYVPLLIDPGLIAPPYIDATSTSRIRFRSSP